MRNEITLHEVNGRKLLKIRTKSPAPKIFKDARRYCRKVKHQGGRGW